MNRSTDTRKAKPRRLAECLVLIVDDDRDCAQFLARLLQLMGCRVCTASDGPEAVALAGKAEPDLVLMDISLPTMSGYDAARAIRAESRGRDVILVAVTGWDGEDSRRRSAEAGCDFHMVKPIDIPELERRRTSTTGRRWRPRPTTPCS